MRIVDDFKLDDVRTARAIVRAHPFATLVGADRRATHMPLLVDEESDGLVLLGHVAKADPACAVLDGPLLAIFHGPQATCRRAGTRTTGSRPGTTSRCT